MQHKLNQTEFSVNCCLLCYGQFYATRYLKFWCT